jgi:hypothetical protein
LLLICAGSFKRLRFPQLILGHLSSMSVPSMFLVCFRILHIQLRISLLIAFISSTSIPQAAEEPANVSLINVGLIGCSPIQPTIAISLKCLELYHQVRRRKPSFSIQAMVKVLCALHNACNFVLCLNLL